MTIQDARRINLLWLLRLRWVAILGQIATIVAVQTLLEFGLAQPPLFAVLGIEIASNLACVLWARRGLPVAEWLLGLLLVADVCFLTALLALTGGAYNPFSFLYLIHIALGAVTLRPIWAWAVVALATLLFGSLFILSPESGDHAAHAQHFRMHLEGMWVAFAVAAWFIAYFVQRVTAALRDRDRELIEARDLAARHERLASLTTLAAGAAHELGSPLATIAIAARELERQLPPSLAAGEAAADVRLIREQVERCRAILVQLTHGAGEALGEAPRATRVRDLIDTAIAGLPDSASIRVDVDPAHGALSLLVPIEAATQSLRNVIKNAVEASPAEDSVRVSTRLRDGGVGIDIRDSGPGIPAEVLDRLGEPFFTTKEVGRGTGLGLFLSRSILARIDGRLEIESTPGQGSVATIVLPVAAAR